MAIQKSKVNFRNLTAIFLFYNYLYRFTHICRTDTTIIPAMKNRAALLCLDERSILISFAITTSPINTPKENTVRGIMWRFCIISFIEP